MTTPSYFQHPPSQPSLKITGHDQLFPVGRIFCVGRNYADHAKEMGAAAEAIFFMKPGDTITQAHSIPYPAQTQHFHHEVELVLALGDKHSIVGAAVGIDLTRRDLQTSMKAKGAPWEIGKSFDASAPIGDLKLGPAPKSASISLEVNGQIRQNGNLDQMLLSPQELVAELLNFFTLKPGDLIFTGTPAGVGPLHRNDKIVAKIDGLPTLNLTIT
jgi:fumarylpyruvate hydrolase